MIFPIILFFTSSLCIAMEPATSLQTPRLSKRERKEKRKQQHDDLFVLTKSFIDKKRDLNVPFKDGEFAGKTILTVAATHRDFKDILELALNAGADPNMADGNKKTPLKVTVSKHCRSAFKYLIKKGAIAKDKGLIQEICGAWHDTLHQNNAKKRVSILEMLLENKATANELDEHGNTCLYHLLWGWTPTREKLTEQQQTIFYSQRKNMITLLLKAGLDVAHKNNAHQTAIENIKAHPHLEDKELLAFLETESKKNYAVKK